MTVEQGMEFKKELLNQIEEETDRARDIVRSILDYSKAGNKELVNLRKVINDTVRFMKAEIPPKIELSTEDIDFFIEDSPENIIRLKKALLSIYDDPSIEELKPDEISQYAVIRYGTPDDFYIDFIGRIGKVFSFKDIEKDIEIFEIDDIKIPVCGLETLIKMKETMRDRDMRDLIFLKKKAEERKKD